MSGVRVGNARIAVHRRPVTTIPSQAGSGHSSNGPSSPRSAARSDTYAATALFFLVLPAASGGTVIGMSGRASGFHAQSGDRARVSVVADSVGRIMLVDVQLSGSPVVVDDQDDAVVLELIDRSELLVRQAELQKLRLATHWAERHVVSDVLDAARWTDADVRDIEETIGGAGTPLVASRCVEPLAAALGVSARTAMQLMSDGLDLAHRLPHTNARMERLELAPWRARRIATATHHVSREAAAWVDAKLAPVADSCGVVRIERLVTETIARFDPVEQAEDEDEAMAAWGIRIDDLAGPVWGRTSRMEVIGSTPILHAFYDLVSARAHELLDHEAPAALQPTLGQRRISALAQIAERGGATTRTTAYLHFDLADLQLLPDAMFRIGTAEKLGPAGPRPSAH